MSRNSRIVIVPEGGLGNRMNAVSSAFRLAEVLQSAVEIVWFRDWGLGCRFSDLFAPIVLPPVAAVGSPSGTVDGRPSLLTIREATLADKLLYDRPRMKNLFVPALFEHLLFDRRMGRPEATQCRHSGFDFPAWCRGRRVWMVTCDYFMSKAVPDGAFSMFRPNARLQERIDRVARQFGSHTMGVHIRRTDSVQAIRQSPTDLFIERMRQEPADTMFYLATDSEEEKATLREAFPGRIITSDKKAERGNLEGMEDAVTDLFLLARTGHILGSFYSSFSVVATQISGGTLEIIKRT